MLVTAVVLLANLLLYTAWDKKQGALSATALADVLLARNGFGEAAVQLNKIVGLTGLTLLALAFAPLSLLDREPREGLLLHAAATQVAHGVFSLATFYGESHIPRLETWASLPDDLAASSSKVRLIGLRKISAGAGGLALAALCWLAAVSQDPTAETALALATVVLSCTHFYFMEVDFKLILQVRPFGFAPFVVSGFAAAALVLRLYVEAKDALL